MSVIITTVSHNEDCTSWHRLIVTKESGEYELRCYRADVHGRALSGMPEIVRTHTDLPKVLEVLSEACYKSAIGLDMSSWALSAPGHTKKTFGTSSTGGDQ